MENKINIMLNKENGFALPVRWKFPEAGNYIFTFIALLITLLLIYCNSFYGEWHFDDFTNIRDNPHIQIKSFSWPEIKQCSLGIYQDRLLRPLSYLSFALNYKFGGMDVFWFHLVNFSIHYIAAVFLFLLVYNTLKLPLLREKYAVIAYPVALLATYFWAINPVQVTSVSYIVQRMASMAGMFYIMSMFFYLKARTTQNRVYSISFFILCFFAGLAAMFSKENAVMLPVSILLFDLFFISGLNKQNIIKFSKLIFLPLLLILIIGFIYSGGFSNAFGGYEARDFSMMQRLLTEPRVILFYLSLLFYPISSRLTLLYDIDISRSLFQPWTTIPSIFLILIIIAFAFYLARKRPLISFCIIFYFLNHLIEGSVLPLELIYTHRNYLPSMLLFVPLAEFIIYAIDYFAYKKVIQIIVALGIVIIAVAAGDNTYQYNKIMSNDFLLWFDNIEKSPRLSRPHSNLGRIYSNNYMNEKAFSEYEKAVELNNFGNKSIIAIQDHNFGLLYFREMKNDLALKYFLKTSAVLPDYLQNVVHIAKIKLRQNKIQEAKKVTEDKLKKYPDNPELTELYSFILLKCGKYNEAQYFAKKRLIQDSKYEFSLKIMAETCRKKKNYPCAISYWKSLQLLNPQNSLINLALIELFAIINDSTSLNREISLFLYLKGSLTIDNYIKELTTDRELLIYVPKSADVSLIVKKYFKEQRL